MSKFLPYDKATKTLSRKEKIGQSFMPAAYINDTEEEIRALEELIRNNRVGGICFFHSRASAATNFEGKKEVIYNESSLQVLKELIYRYQKASKYPLLISIDAEWGLAMRIEKTPKYPFAISLGAIPDNPDLVFRVGQQIGSDCREAGIHWNFAPVADVNNNPDNPVIGYRSFGEDPKKVASYATAFSKGLQSTGVLTSAKHFPGHGDTATDSHLGMPLIDKSLEQLLDNELIPFRALIENEVDSVMVGHLSIPALSNGKSIPSTVSADIINGFLREDLGFMGVVVSDALNMHSVSKMFDDGELELTAYQAGIDVLCYTEHVAAGISAIDQKSADSEIEIHFKRVWELKQKVFDRFERPLVFEQAPYRELMHELAENTLCELKGNPGILANLKTIGYKGLVAGRTGNSIFMESIEKECGAEWRSTANLSNEEISTFLSDTTGVLMALYPPQVKPTGLFGFEENEINFVKELAGTKKVVLYLFGNPYVLNLMNPDNFEGIWIAFQDFEEYQIHAASQFTNNGEAVGVLPVSIKHN